MRKLLSVFVTSCLRFSAGYPYTDGFSFDGVYMYTTCFWPLGGLFFDTQLALSNFTAVFCDHSANIVSCQGFPGCIWKWWKYRSKHFMIGWFFVFRFTVVRRPFPDFWIRFYQWLYSIFEGIWKAVPCFFVASLHVMVLSCFNWLLFSHFFWRFAFFCLTGLLLNFASKEFHVEYICSCPCNCFFQHSDVFALF